MQICEYGCGKEATHQFKTNKRWCCSANVNACDGKRGADSEKKKGLVPKWKNGHPRGMLGKTQSIKGKTYVEFFGEERAKELIQRCVKGGKAVAGRIHSDETKEKIRQIALKRHADGWDNKAGRCKKYNYVSPIAGEITVDGTWELKVAQWLDLKGYNWRRNKERFKYVHLNGKIANYVPDFWVEELGGYLEVKGYETDLDRCKWSQFKEKLTVWKKNEISEIITCINKIMDSGQDGNATDY